MYRSDKHLSSRRVLKCGVCRLAFYGSSLALGTGQGKVIMYGHSPTLEHVFTAVVHKSVVTCIAMDQEIIVRPRPMCLVAR